MARPLKLYNHAVAPNPRRVRIFAAEKGIELSLEEVDILAGQCRTPEFLGKNSSGGVPVLELDDGSCLSESVAICRYLEGLHPEPNLLGARSPRTGGDREVEPADGAGTVRCHRTHGSKYQSDLPRPFQAIPGLRRSSAYSCLSAPRTDGSRPERTPVHRGGPLHNRRHHGVGGNRYRRPFGRHKNSSGTRVFDPLARASIEPSKRQGVRTETPHLRPVIRSV
jgi:Glutathione S-transferase, N-terminal domain